MVFPTPSSSRAVLSNLRLSLRLGSQTYRFRLPSLTSSPHSSPSQSSSSYESSTPPFPPSLATVSASPVSSLPPSSTSSSWLEQASEITSSLWNGILLAVPKKKVSHSRKSMRAANKGLKNRNDLVHCSACGRPKLHHHICSHCYFELSRNQKQAQRMQLQQGSPQEAQQQQQQE